MTVPRGSYRLPLDGDDQSIDKITVVEGAPRTIDLATGTGSIIVRGR